MQRAILALSLGLAATFTPSGASASNANANLLQDPQVEAKRLYDEGKTAYRLGRFEEAAAKFESAYGASGLPTILFNVGLAYERLYTTSNDVGDLRKAVAVLENFLLEVQKDPTLGDPSEIESQIETIKKRIADHEKRDADAAAAEAARLKAEQDAKNNGNGNGNDVQEPVEPYVPVGPDPGAKDRKLGGIIMGVGGAVAVGGVVGGLVIGGQGQGFEDDLVASYTTFGDLGCMDASDSSDCAALATQQENLRKNGKSANALAYGMAIGGGVVGLALVGTGVGLMMRGKKRTTKWKGGPEVSILPTGRGFVLNGRF